MTQQIVLPRNFRVHLILDYFLVSERLFSNTQFRRKFPKSGEEPAKLAALRYIVGVVGGYQYNNRCPSDFTQSPVNHPRRSRLLVYIGDFPRPHCAIHRKDRKTGEDVQTC